MNNDNDISNEDNNLNEMAPKLSKLSSNNPFCRDEHLKSVSDAYFDGFSSKLQNRINDIEDIKAFAPTLLEIPKYNPFEVPADYFDELPTIVQECILESKNKRSRFEWIILLLKPRFAFPMIVILFITIAGINYMNKNAELKNTEEELSLEDHLYYIDEIEIIDQLTADASIEAENVSTDESSIENYLLDNNIDESNLNNEL